ncbi:uncharacterized protein [Eucyclogobius newberryi]|uniref:uncharacterized protein n=1 Tax=Eucyclogobius newberryi TaxID=166745 RepID=UPI003B5BB887
MKVALELGSVWLYLVLVVLTSASQTRAQTRVFPPIISSTSTSLDTKGEDLRLRTDGGQTIQSLTDSTDTTAEVTAFSITDGFTPATAITPVSKTQAGAVTSSTAPESPVDTHTPLGSSTTQIPGHTFSSQPASASLGGTPSILPSADPLLVSLSTASAQTTGAPQGIAGPTHQETPSQLNVGGEDSSGSVRRSLDPLLAGLLSVFIVTTAVIFVVLFLKFRHQNNNPEFHRLQDLPMDDLMEDTPLSRYTY